MTGMTFDEFYDAVYFGTEIDFEHQGGFYHINSGFDNGKYGIVVTKYNAAPWEQSSNLSGRVIYEKILETQTEAVTDFLSSSIFSGKCFNDIMDSVKIHFC